MCRIDVSDHVLPFAGAIPSKMSFFAMLYLPKPEKCFFSRQWFGQPMKMEFEGQMFSVPQNWDGVLQNLYGDYMTPPPEEQRRCTHESKLIENTDA